MAASRDRTDVGGAADTGTAVPGTTDPRGERSGTRPTTEGTTGTATTRGTEGIGTGETERTVPLSTEGRSVPTRFGRTPSVGWPGFFASPWEFMHQVNEGMNHLFENFGLGPSGLAQVNYPGLRQTSGLRSGLTADRANAMVYPDIEVLQRQNGVVVRADLPGLDAKDISVYVDDGALVITGEREREEREEREGYVRSEVRYGTFFRTIPLPRGADEDKVAATFKNGVLEVTVPIAEQQQGKKIAIKA